MAGTDVFDAINAEVRTLLGTIFDAVGEGWFWDKKYNMKTKIALSGPFRRDRFGGTNCTDDRHYTVRLQIWTRGRTDETVVPNTTKAIQDIEDLFHHSTPLLASINAAIDGVVSTNVIDVDVEVPNPIPEIEDDEDNDQQFINKMVVDLKFWVERAFAAK